jgi:hypothetical protein
VKTRVLWAAIALLVCVTRFCHVDLVWIEEAYPLAAAAEVLRGKLLYRDVWFDKPPLYALIYTLWGAQQGWLLRVAGSIYVLLASAAVWIFARDYWGEKEARYAASLLAFFLTFGIPSAVIALAPDLLMIVPHVLAVWLAFRGKSYAAGATAGMALLFNSKGVFVLPACLLWPGRLQVLSGFAISQFISAAVLPREYWSQVWLWGFRYSGNTFLAHPFAEGIRRTLNWSGFHIALLLAAAIFFRKEPQANKTTWRFAAWGVLSLVAVAAGWRFFPRYYFHLLPVVVLMAARGLTLANRRMHFACALLLLVPLIRFAPRYVSLAVGQRNWSDLAMMNDSRNAASHLPSGDIFVWGYRPDIFVFARRQAASPFLDSQPLTGVAADRHLFDAKSIDEELAARNRALLVRTRPAYIVDGLGPLNPRLAITNFKDLQPWLTDYREVARTAMSIVYQRLERQTILE